MVATDNAQLLVGHPSIEMLDHVHIPVVTDESPSHPALSLTVCAICLETLDATAHHKPAKAEKIDRETLLELLLAS